MRVRTYVFQINKINLLQPQTQSTLIYFSLTLQVSFASMNPDLGSFWKVQSTISDNGVKPGRTAEEAEPLSKSFIHMQSQSICGSGL